MLLFSQYLWRQYWTYKMTAVYLNISINISASRWNTIEMLVINHMFSGSRNKTVLFRKVVNSSHIGFSRWPPYKKCFINILASKWYTIELLKKLLKNHVFRVKEYNCTVRLEKQKMAAILNFQGQTFQVAIFYKGWKNAKHYYWYQIGIQVFAIDWFLVPLRMLNIMTLTYIFMVATYEISKTVKASETMPNYDFIRRWYSSSNEIVVNIVHFVTLTKIFKLKY